MTAERPCARETRRPAVNVKPQQQSEINLQSAITVTAERQSDFHLEREVAR